MRNIGKGKIQSFLCSAGCAGAEQPFRNKHPPPRPTAFITTIIIIVIIVFSIIPTFIR